MKKIIVPAIVFSFLVGTAMFYRPAHAADHIITIHSKGSNCSDNVSFDPASININSGEVVSFVLPKDDPSLDGVVINNFPGGSFTVVPGAQPKSTPSLVIDVPSYYATRSSNACQVGTGSVTVKQVTTPQPTPPPPPPATVTQVQPLAAQNKPPATLKLDQVSIGGDKIDISKPISIDKSKSLNISGYTIPGGVIDITIHSTVRNEIIRADTAGHWSFVVENLEPGNHTLDAKVTDQATHLTSETATLLKFAVTGKQGATNSLVAQVKNEGPKRKANIALLIAASTLLMIVIGAVTFWMMKVRKKTNKQPETAKPVEPIVPPTPPVEIQPTV
jgi:hypothetical protein